MNPKVSICIPSKNTFPYLEERKLSIQKQTLTDYEVIIVDDDSTDGSKEFFSEWEYKDHRVKVFDGPGKGLYAGWNDCISRACGKYIYIATSDDTMEDSLLEKMVSMLEDNIDCEIAHCCLSIIDENGQKSSILDWDNFEMNTYFGELTKKKHIRYAPHDGILYCSLRTVYTSINQLLIKREVFDKIGLFLTDCGSIADFEWGLRASLCCNVIHIPEYLAKWRIHDQQVTQIDFNNSPNIYKSFISFIDHSFNLAIKKKLLDPKYYNISLKAYYENLHFLILWSKKNSLKEKIKIFIKYNRYYRQFLFRKITKTKMSDNISFAKAKIQMLNLKSSLKVIK